MGNIVSWKEVMLQSNTVFNQFGELKWIPYAKENAKLDRRNAFELRNYGIGKFMLCCGMGESLEANIEIIKRYRNRFDIMTCDKGFGVLLEHGVKADFVMLCDCNIPFKYIEKYVNETENVGVICTPYANPEWTKVWKGKRYFVVNQDSIESEKIFLPIMGMDTRVIPAGSNVSNAMIIFTNGADEYQNINFMGYEKYILVGYDYSWRPLGNYYAWTNPTPKRNYMCHRTMLDIKGDIVHTSENLLFSAKWLYSYITTFHLPVVNACGRGLLDIPNISDLEFELKYIREEKESIDNLREHFEVMKEAYKLNRNADMLFQKAREARYDYRCRV